MIFFLNEDFLGGGGVIGTKPLKRLPTYLSHRGLGPNVVRNFFLKNEFFFQFFFEMKFLFE